MNLLFVNKRRSLQICSPVGCQPPALSADAQTHTIRLSHAIENDLTQVAPMVPETDEDDDFIDEPIDGFDPTAFDATEDQEIEGETDEAVVPTQFAFDESVPDDEDALTAGVPFESLLSVPKPDEEADENPDRITPAGFDLEPVALQGDEDDEATIAFSLDLPSPPLVDDNELAPKDSALDVEEETFVEERVFELGWQSDKTTQCLLAYGDRVIGLGKEATLYAPAGEVEQIWPTPERLVAAAMFTSRGNEPALPTKWLACGMSGALYNGTLGRWRRVPLEKASQRILTLDGKPHVQLEDSRWLAVDGERPDAAFAGQRLADVCFTDRLLAIQLAGYPPELVALNASTRISFPAPLSDRSRLVALGKALVVTGGLGHLWVSSDAGQSFTRVRGVDQTRGAAIGFVGSDLKYWTTRESPGAAELLEVDVTSGAVSLAALLPWPASDDDAPLVTALLWQQSERRLTIASDRGVVSLLRWPFLS